MQIHQNFMIRKLLLLLVTCWFACAVRGQSFINTYNFGSGFSGINRICEGPGNSMYAAGWQRDTNTLRNILTRLDAEGNPIWGFSPAEARESRALVPLNDGSFLFFNSNLEFQGYFDASVLHVDANGVLKQELLWGLPGDQDDWFAAARFDNGEVVASGISREEQSFSQRAFFVRFSATGVPIWERTFDFGNIGSFNRILPLPDGSFYAGGNFFVSVERINILAKFNADGSIAWVKSYDYDGKDLFWTGLIRLNDGTLGVSAIPQFGPADYEAVFIRLDADGNVLFHRTYETDQTFQAQGLEQLSPDTLLMHGSFFLQNEADQAIIRISPEGEILGALAYGFDALESTVYGIRIGTEIVQCGSSVPANNNGQTVALISRSRVDVSCCELPIEAVPGPGIALFVQAIPAFTIGTVPPRQLRNISQENVAIVKEQRCVSPDQLDLLPPLEGLCLGDTINIGLQTTLPGAVLWSTGDSTRSIQVAAPGLYTATLNSECGISTDTVLVERRGNRVIIQTETALRICPGDSLQLNASGGTVYEWRSNGQNILEGPNPVFTTTQSALLQLLVRDGDCLDSVQVAVEVLPAPKLMVSPEFDIAKGEQVQLQTTGAVFFQWSPSGGLSCSDCAAPLAMPDSTTTYVLIGATADGCKDTAIVLVRVKQPCPYYIPNVFSPDSGNENAAFGVLGLRLSPETFSMRIYSRWGELLFETRNAQEQWDGQFRGKPAPTGVYLYQLEMQTCDALVETAGTLTLIR
jgi:gliding motility-associated-like protein